MADGGTLLRLRVLSRHMLRFPPREYPVLAAFSQVIVAGGSEDISAQDMLEWIAPVLEGIPDGLWLSCELVPSGGRILSVKIRSGRVARHLPLCRTIPRLKARAVLNLLPATGPAAVVLLNDHAAQIMTLLDGMASWLNLFEKTDPRLAPLLALLADCSTPERLHKPA